MNIYKFNFFFIYAFLIINLVHSNQLQEQQYCEKNCYQISKCDETLACKIQLDHCSLCQSTNTQLEKLECLQDCLMMDFEGKIDSQALDYLECSNICVEEYLYDKKNVIKIKKAYIHHKLPILQQIFQSRPGWELLPFQEVDSTYWDFKWMFFHHQLNYNPINKENQIGNKINNLQKIIGNKYSLLLLLRQFDEEKKYLDLLSNKYLPITYAINIWKSQFSDEENELFKRTEHFWIIKTPSGYGGEGLRIYKDIQQVKQVIIKQKGYLNMKKINKKKFDQHIIVQKYIENPLLIENKKFDIRCFVLIANTDPFLVLFHHGYIRRTLSDFTLDLSDWTQAQQLIHITNTHMQEKHPNFSNLKEQHGWNFTETEDYLKTTFNKTQMDLDSIWLLMKRIMAYTFTAALPQLERQQGSFHLTGNDFMLDDQFNLIFLEANQNPRLQQHFKGERECAPFIAQSTIDIVLQIQGNSQKKIKWLLQKASKRLNLQGWDILINEQTGYNYLQEKVSNQQN